MFADIAVVCLFDRPQCPPVPAKPGSRVAFGARKESTFFDDVPFVRREMCHEWIRLTYIRRSECKQLNEANRLASQGAYIPLNRTMGVSSLPLDCPSVLCWRNDTRKRINALMGERFLQTGATALPPFKTNKYSDDKLQEFTFCVGMPVVSLRNKKYVEDDDAPYSKNDLARITAYADKQVTLLIEEKVPMTFGLNEFFRTFYPGFAITTHQAQGSTLAHNYAIADSHSMQKNDFRIFYTALSRAKRFSQVHEFCF